MAVMEANPEPTGKEGQTVGAVRWEMAGHAWLPHPVLLYSASLQGLP